MNVKTDKKVNKKIKNIIDKIEKYLINKYGINSVKATILYGSHARGEVRESSDIDVLVVVNNSLDPMEVRKSLSEIILDILLNDGELVSIVVVRQNFFENYKSPFILNVKREGVRI